MCAINFWQRDHRATLMMTLAEGSWCKQKVMDPMDPRCARIVLTGKIKTVCSHVLINIIVFRRIHFRLS